MCALQKPFQFVMLAKLRGYALGASYFSTLRMDSGQPVDRNKCLNKVVSLALNCNEKRI